MYSRSLKSNVVSIESNSDQWEIYLNNLLFFLKLYQEILDAYVLDFYSKHLWNLFPKSWKEAFEDFTPLELSDFLNWKTSLRSKLTKVLPLSLLAFRITCFSFALPRTPIAGTKDLNFHHQEKELLPVPVHNNFKNRHENLSEGSSTDHLEYETNWEAADKELTGGQHFLLAHIFRKHLKPKKQHEVLRMAQLSSKISHCAEAEVVVDVGSGQGHLARLIAYGFSIPTVCLEAEENLVEEARKFDLQLEETLRKTKHKCCSLHHQSTVVGPRHEACRLNPHMTPEEFSRILNKVWPEFSTGENVQKKKPLTFSIVGLHCCGDLSPTLMRLFSSMSSCKSLILVSCCYMKLTTAKSEESFRGYPMSEFVKKKKNNGISYTAREMACHALEGYVKKLKRGADDLKVHCYRAVLEELIVQKNPELEHSGLRSLKNAHLLSFGNYVEKALSRLKEVSFSEEELLTIDVSRKLSDWMKVVIFYSIRLMMAPAVESLILLDKLYYLREKTTDAKCFIAPIFDPSLSPRNYALIAMKRSLSRSLVCDLGVHQRAAVGVPLPL